MKKSPKQPRGTMSALAEKTGIPYQTLSRWKREGTDIFSPPALAERMARIKQAPPENLTDARLQKLLAETARINLALDVERGRFVDSHTIENDGRAIGQLVRSTHDRAVQELPPMLAGRTAGEIQPILKRYFRDMQTDLAKFQSTIKL